MIRAMSQALVRSAACLARSATRLFPTRRSPASCRSRLAIKAQDRTPVLPGGSRVPRDGGSSDGDEGQLSGIGVQLLRDSGEDSVHGQDIGMTATSAVGGSLKLLLDMVLKLWLIRIGISWAMA